MATVKTRVKRKAKPKKTAKKKARPSRLVLARARRIRHKKSQFPFSVVSDFFKKNLWFFPSFLILILIGVLIRPLKSPHTHRIPTAHDNAKIQDRSSLKNLHSTAKIEGLFDQANQLKTRPQKIIFWSNQIHQDPDLFSSISPGPEINDYAPLFPRGYDCTTFVETVSSLARSKNINELAENLITIRYKDGEISYETRNHFPEADWIPNNQNNGTLKDITIEVSRKAGFLVSFVNKDINKIAWFHEQKRIFNERSLASANLNSETEIQNQAVRLPYLPIHKTLDSLMHIPEASIINVVRENKANKPVIITHQGFLIWKNGIAYFRHASKNKKITEIPFSVYVKQAQAMPWKVIGFNINQVQ